MTRRWLAWSARSTSSAPACSAPRSALACRRAGLEVCSATSTTSTCAPPAGLGAGEPAPTEARRAAGRGRRAARPHRRGGRRGAASAGRWSPTSAASRAGPLTQVADRADEALARYVGSHPMAGSERSGPLAASAALFDGRPWAVTPHAHSAPGAVALVEALARLCGAEPVRLSPGEHDRAVARTSHLPHLLAVLDAGQLAERPARAPRPVGAGGARRHPDRRRRPGRCGARSSAPTPPAVRELLRDVRGRARRR